MKTLECIKETLLALPLPQRWHSLEAEEAVNFSHEESGEQWGVSSSLVLWDAAKETYFSLAAPRKLKQDLNDCGEGERVKEACKTIRGHSRDAVPADSSLDSSKKSNHELLGKSHLRIPPTGPPSTPMPWVPNPYLPPQLLVYISVSGSQSDLR